MTGVLIRRPCEHTKRQTRKEEGHVKTEKNDKELYELEL